MATRKPIWIMIGILIISAWLLGSVTQAGAQTYTVKCQAAQHIIKAQAIEVGDVPGHNLIVYELGGLTFCDDGSIALNSFKGMGDYIRGSGPFQGYCLNTYEDGSTTWFKIGATATAAPDGKTASFEGTIEYIKGTGRFEGIQGGGPETGKRFAPVPGAGAEIYCEWTVTYTLPSK